MTETVVVVFVVVLVEVGVVVVVVVVDVVVVDNLAEPASKKVRLLRMANLRCRPYWVQTLGE